MMLSLKGRENLLVHWLAMSPRLLGPDTALVSTREAVLGMSKLRLARSTFRFRLWLAMYRRASISGRDKPGGRWRIQGKVGSVGEKGVSQMWANSSISHG